MSIPIVRATALAAVALALGACKRDEVSHYQVPKESAAPGTGGMGMGGAPPGMAGEVPPPPRPSGGGALAWTLPKAWTETHGGDAMRFATLKPPVDGRIDVSVVVLPGTAGGELANVNRWRGQIGLPPLDDAGLSKVRRDVATKAGRVSLYDFTSEGQTRTRLVAGLAVVEGNSWFLKMMGDERAVGAARPDFLRLVESLRLAQAD
ncbi:MAG TPA: hypothetical protein VEP68_04805 [Anaeromyxobacteraceae bacterium]|nr:hypothetical protein [Anaeromyxobacteraceae bacterium]